MRNEMRKDEDDDVNGALRRDALRLAREHAGRPPAGPAALAEANLRLVWKMADRIGRRPGVSFDDLVSMGHVGLVSAAHRYDPAIATFSTLACTSIHRAILRGLETSPELPIATPTGILNHSAAARAGSAALEETYQHILDLRRRIDEGRIERDSGPDGPLDRRVACPGAPPEERAIREEEAELLHRMIGRLPERERAFTLLHMEGSKDVAIAREHGVSKSLVCDVRRRARERLRAMLAPHLGDEP